MYYRLFDDLLKTITEDFKQKKDAPNWAEHTSRQKILVALRWLATGRSFDDLDDTARISEESIRQACNKFCARMVEYFSDRCLHRTPTQEELQEIETNTIAQSFMAALEQSITINDTERTVPEVWKDSSSTLKTGSWQ